MSFEVEFATLPGFLDTNVVIYIEVTPLATKITEKFDIEFFYIFKYRMQPRV
jgi:hypothetical protein